MTLTADAVLESELDIPESEPAQHHTSAILTTVTTGHLLRPRQGLGNHTSRASDEHDVERQQSSENIQDNPNEVNRHQPAQRRRNLTKCLLCRTRNIKCDNKRPSCGYCILHGADCAYPDAPIDPAPLGLGIGLRTLQATSQNDVPNSVILERVNHAVSLLENPRRNRVVANFSAEIAITYDSLGQLEITETAAKTSACESILRWPMLHDFSIGEQVTSFPLQAAANELSTEQRRQLPLDQDSIWPLCQRFLVLIHVKNPVLDVTKFKRYAREASEFGPGWDGPGCLVLLGCALACLTSPYDPAQARNIPDDGVDFHDFPSSLDRTTEANGEAFFNAAQRRLGLLPNSLISIQCTYFAGLYEKFAIRPLDAWHKFRGACVRFQALLYAKALSSNTVGHEEQRAIHVEQRLYWSCVKAESELRTELQLPASGLLHFNYRDLFPALPFPPELQNSSPMVQTERELDAGLMDQNPASDPDNYNALEEELGWLYYLADVSLHTIKNHVLVDLYSHGEKDWLDDMPMMARKYNAYKKDLGSWRNQLPLQLQFPGSSNSLDCPGRPGNELSFFLQTRYLCVIELLYRPLLYCALHYHPSRTRVHYTDLFPLAQQSINASCILIRLVATHHCHGGTWILTRRSFGCSLLLVAVARYKFHKGGPENRLSPLGGHCFQLPPDWLGVLRMTLASLRRWEGSGARDVQWMRETLERLIDIAKTWE
ncbi:hypothetical protein F4677DRAFT_456315 [Hypoxylon crocopeplum]|nr:hypothetical protein F4677DRAFT_456315 [Hypoxylon crocopeplum]